MIRRILKLRDVDRCECGRETLSDNGDGVDAGVRRWSGSDDEMSGAKEMSVNGAEMEMFVQISTLYRNKTHVLVVIIIYSIFV